MLLVLPPGPASVQPARGRGWKARARELRLPGLWQLRPPGLAVVEARVAVEEGEVAAVAAAAEPDSICVYVTCSEKTRCFRFRDRIAFRIIP